MMCHRIRKPMNKARLRTLTRMERNCAKRYTRASCTTGSVANAKAATNRDTSNSLKASTRMCLRMWLMKGLGVRLEWASARCRDRDETTSNWVQAYDITPRMEDLRGE